HRYQQGVGMYHLGFNHILDRLQLIIRRLEYQLVVHLEDHPALHIFHMLMDLHHGELDEIRRTALDGGVDGDPPRTLPHVEVIRFDLGDAPAPAHDGRYEAVLLSRAGNALHVLLHARVLGEVVFDVAFRHIALDTELP